jgi:thymidylate synthase ThyX
VRRNGIAQWSGNSHELVRHRIASFGQESTRYCNYSKGKFGEHITVIEPLGFPDPEAKEQKLYQPGGTDFVPVTYETLHRWFNLLMDEEVDKVRDELDNSLFVSYDERQLWQQAMRWADQSYRTMTSIGSPPGRARHVLPISTKAEIGITANLREWMHIFDLRCAPTAHLHIRTVMLNVLVAFAGEFPVLYQPILDTMKEMYNGVWEEVEIILHEQETVADALYRVVEKASLMDTFDVYIEEQLDCTAKELLDNNKAAFTPRAESFLATYLHHEAGVQP